MAAYNTQPSRRPSALSPVESLDQGYHMPHNAAYVGELRLLLEVLRERGPITFTELTAQMFFEQLNRGCFEEYHSKPHECFSDGWAPPDFPSIVTALRSQDRARAFVQARARNYQALQAGRMSLPDFMESPYKPASSWRRVWVEYARDYIDFAAMLKMAYRGDGSACCLLERGKAFLTDPAVLDEAFLQFPIRVWVDNGLHTIHPFWLVLTLLARVQAARIPAVELKALMHLVSHLPGDAHVEIAVARLIETRGGENPSIDASANKEAQRFSLPIRKFLGERGLIEESRRGRLTYLEITNRGRTLLKLGGRS